MTTKKLSNPSVSYKNRIKKPSRNLVREGNVQELLNVSQINSSLPLVSSNDRVYSNNIFAWMFNFSVRIVLAQNNVRFC
jgi:hypothetical protein